VNPYKCVRREILEILRCGNQCLTISGIPAPRTTVVQAFVALHLERGRDGFWRPGVGTYACIEEYIAIRIGAKLPNDVVRIRAHLRRVEQSRRAALVRWARVANHEPRLLETA
jgi:hypothetical protein